jgi:hypothetical protein
MARGWLTVYGIYTLRLCVWLSEVQRTNTIHMYHGLERGSSALPSGVNETHPRSMQEWRRVAKRILRYSLQATSLPPSAEQFSYCIAPQTATTTLMEEFSLEKIIGRR